MRELHTHSSHQDHKEEEDNRFQCRDCDERYSHSSALRRHKTKCKGRLNKKEEEDEEDDEPVIPKNHDRLVELMKDTGFDNNTARNLAKFDLDMVQDDEEEVYTVYEPNPNYFDGGNNQYHNNYGNHSYNPKDEFIHKGRQFYEPDEDEDLPEYYENKCLPKSSKITSTYEVPNSTNFESDSNKTNELTTTDLTKEDEEEDLDGPYPPEILALDENSTAYYIALAEEDYRRACLKSERAEKERLRKEEARLKAYSMRFPNHSHDQDKKNNSEEGTKDRELVLPPLSFMIEPKTLGKMPLSKPVFYTFGDLVMRCIAPEDYIACLSDIMQDRMKAIVYIKNIGVAYDQVEADFRLVKKIYFEGKTKSQIPFRVLDLSRHRYEFLDADQKWHNDTKGQICGKIIGDNIMNALLKMNNDMIAKILGPVDEDTREALLDEYQINKTQQHAHLLSGSKYRIKLVTRMAMFVHNLSETEIIH